MDYYQNRHANYVKRLVNLSKYMQSLILFRSKQANSKAVEQNS